MAGLAALPVVARGAPADLLAAAAPVVALWLGQPLGRWLPGGALAGALLAALPCVVAAWLLR
jgi:hypothetical protein